MDIETISLKQPPSNQRNTIRKSTSVRKTTKQRDKDLVLTSRKRLCPWISETTIRIIFTVIFISIAMITGILIVCLTSPKKNKTCQMTFKRTMRSLISYDSQPRSLAHGDFNHDQYTDMVVANSGTHTIGIFILKNDGNFQQQQTYSTGFESSPYSVIVNHFNHDQYLDIAVANYGTHTIGIFLGHGNGTFSDQLKISTNSSRPFYITSGDINNDNRTDLVVVNYGTNDINILIGYGNGSFDIIKNYFIGYDSNPYSVVVTDLNHDYVLDIVVANYGTNNIGIFFGYGNGTFTNQYIYTTGLNSNPTSIGIADFNHDNHLDIIVCNSNSGNIGLFLGYGNGTFTSQILYSLGLTSHPQYLTITSLNKTSDLNVIILDSDNDQMHVLSDYNDRSFKTIATYDTPIDSYPCMLVVNDFDNNNQVDIAIINYDTSNILVVSGYSTNPSTRQINYFLGNYPYPPTVAIVDLNKDNYLDIVVNIYDNGNMMQLSGSSNETFLIETIYSFGYEFYPVYFRIVDLNNDTQMDIIMTNYGLNSIGILLGQDNGTYINITRYSTGINSYPAHFALADFNNDGLLDIVTCNCGTSTLGILLGYGDGTFAPVITYYINNNSNTSYPYAVVVGDVNNDNNTDIVINLPTSVFSNINVYLGYGNGSFEFQMILNIYFSSYTFALSLSDLNNDNYLDIVIANTFHKHLAVYYGDGHGNFKDEPIDLWTGDGSVPQSFVIIDVNNDNYNDIIVASSGTDEVVVLFNNGNDTFNIGRKYPTGFSSSPYTIAVADLNNDKQLEIIVTLMSTGTVAILTQYNAIEFQQQTFYSTDAALHSYSVVIDDLNNDNYSDIVIANAGTNNLGILFGFTNGTFTSATMYPIGIGSHPQDVITDDIDRDGYVDIISVNTKNDSISVIMGEGHGNFSSQIKYSTGEHSRPYAVTIADLNNDNQSDIIVANSGTNNIGIFYRFNYRSFKKQLINSVIYTYSPYQIITVDFNNDSYLDIALTDPRYNYVDILLGYGNGSFTPAVYYSIGDDVSPTALDAGDFNNDNYLDIVVTTYYNIAVLLGYGNGTFASIIITSLENELSLSSIATADFNNDGQLDVIVTNSYNNHINVLFGNGNGSFSNMMVYSTENNSYLYMANVTDCNNDSQMDILVVNYNTGTVNVFLGYGNGSFKESIISLTSYSSGLVSISFGDFNGDYQLDITVANYAYNHIDILFGYGNGSFNLSNTYSTGNGSAPICLSVADFNNDNLLDIAVANTYSDNILIYYGFGDGSFLLGIPCVVVVGSGPISLAIGDFNNDHISDITVAVANSLTDTFYTFLGYGYESYAEVTTYTTGSKSEPHSVKVDDLNNDGRLDIVVANYGNSNIGILLGRSNGVFDPMQVYSTGNTAGPYAVIVADVNNDHQSDLVVTNSETDNIVIFLGFGNGSFGMIGKYSTGIRSRPYMIKTGDFNNDTALDLVIANSGTNNILLLYGYGNGTFGNQTSYSFGYGYQPYSVAVNDLNNDKWLDIVIACYGTDHVETLFQICQ